MTYQRTPALCLRKIDYSETSQVLRFFTLHHGKISCIAKGAKRRRGPFGAPFDVLGEYDLIRFEKRPGTLDIVTQAQRLRTFAGVCAAYGRFAAACYAADFTDSFTEDGLRVEGLYERLTEALERLEGDVEVPDAVFSFEARALKALGFMPRARECGICRGAVRQAEAYFSVRDGGAVCTGCRTRDDRMFLVRRAALESLARFSEGEMPRVRMKRGLVTELRGILDACVHHHLGRDLASARFVRDTIAQAAP
jgi:DNA repair protein RecO (recombination protein O)